MTLADRYQNQLADFVRKVKPSLVVETGGGISTECILKALDDNEKGTLYMIDPDPQHRSMLGHSRLRWHDLTSINVLGLLYELTGPWDIFLHDSDHECECQTFELECAYSMVRPAGWIICDDVHWGQPAHMAFEKFCARHGMSFDEMGSTRIAQKQPDAEAITNDQIQATLEAALKIAHGAAKERGENIVYHLP